MNAQPYRPPPLNPRRVIGGPVESEAKPWLALRPGESRRQWHKRLSHTCYRCGLHEKDRERLDRHEAEHDRPKKGRSDE